MMNFTGTGTDSSTPDGMNLTRVGNFWFGPDGYLAKENDGMCVYGFQCIGVDSVTGKAIFSDQLVPIRVPGVGVKEGSTTGELEIKYPILATEAADGQLTAAANGHVMNQRQQVTGDNGTEVWQDYPATNLEAITIDKVTGVITAKSKDTKELITIGCIAVGVVKNPDGVTNLGDNYYQAGKGSGGLSVSLLGGAAESLGIGYMNQSLRAEGAGGGGDNADDQYPDACRIRDGGETRVLSSGLEMSKTDLAQEISQMILTQRGYQANTRIVTVTDSMLEELVNMKR